MSSIYTSADQLIGKTPLLELVHIEKQEDLEARILAKLEYFNPAGSVKDRIAKAMSLRFLCGYLGGRSCTLFRDRRRAWLWSEPIRCQL